MIEMAPPRIERITGPLRGCCAMSIRPCAPLPLPFALAGQSNRIWPPEICAIFGRMPRIACATTDLPEPDSPTSATVLPYGTRKLTPRTACSGPVSKLKVMRRSRTVSRLPSVSAPTLSCGWMIRSDCAINRSPGDADGGHVVRRDAIHHQLVLARRMRRARDDLGEARQRGIELDFAREFSWGGLFSALERQRHPALFAAARCRIVAQRQIRKIRPANR